MKNFIKIFLELIKVRITVFVMVTTSFGFIVASSSIDIRLLWVSLGILFLAFGSAALNHIQERNFDGMMERTKNRPLPSGRISFEDSMIVMVSLVLVGSTILLYGAGLVPLLLGLLNMVWYNGIYTPLKRKNAMAIIPGSLVGAIPPMVGWAATGRSIAEPQIIFIAFFFFIWQIPHFWLLLLALDKDYEKAGYPVLTKLFNTNQLSRITFMWISAMIATAFLIPFFGILNYSLISGLLIVAAGIWLTFKASILLKKDTVSFKPIFMQINYFVLIIVILVSIDKLIIY